MYVKIYNGQKKIEEVVDNLFFSVIYNKMSSARYIKMHANMINSYINIVHKSSFEPTVKEFVQFYQELNYMIEQIIAKETIILKKIEIISNIGFIIFNKDGYYPDSTKNKEILKLDEDYDLSKVLLEYHSSNSHFLKSLVSFNDIAMPFIYKKNQNNNINYLILKIINNLFELQQLAFKRTELLYYQGHVIYDEEFNKVLINNIEICIKLIKNLLLNNSFNNKYVINKLHKNIILLIRMKKEIAMFFNKNIKNQHFSSPWTSNNIKKNNPKGFP